MGNEGLDDVYPLAVGIPQTYPLLKLNLHDIVLTQHGLIDIIHVQKTEDFDGDIGARVAQTNALANAAEEMTGENLQGVRLVAVQYNSVVAVAVVVFEERHELKPGPAGNNQHMPQVLARVGVIQDEDPSGRPPQTLARLSGSRLRLPPGTFTPVFELRPDGGDRHVLNYHATMIW